MTENIEKTVLMKCEHCGYTEAVDTETLISMRNLPPYTDEDRILCPFCLNYMYPPKTDTANK